MKFTRRGVPYLLIHVCLMEDNISTEVLPRHFFGEFGSMYFRRDDQLPESGCLILELDSFKVIQHVFRP